MPIKPQHSHSSIHEFIINIYRIFIFIMAILFIQSSFALDQALIIQKQIETEQRNLQNRNLKDISDVKKLIGEMYQTDQKVRKLTIKDMQNSIAILYIKQMDQFHTDKMKEILLEHKWISISKFGEETANYAWLIIQHADHDPFFQAGCLHIMSKLEKSEYNSKNYAYLYDRVALKFEDIGMKQKYGTQVQLENGEVKLLPYEGTLDEVERRRKEVNLEPLDEYLLMIKKIYS